MIDLKYDEVFSFERIYKAHIRGRLSKRNKKPIVKFELALLTKLQDIFHKLHERKYKFGGYNHFVVFEPKEREIQTLKYDDRVV